MTPIATAAQALAGLLRAAEEGGLPMPSSAEALSFPPAFHQACDDYERENTGGASLHFGSLDDLTVWSTWLDEPVDDTTVSSDGWTHFRVYGWAGPVPVYAVAIGPRVEVSA